MGDERLDLRRVNFLDLFPWLLLLRGFRLARDPKKIALGAIGALVMCLGWWAISSLATADRPSPPTPLSADATPEQRNDFVRQQADYIAGTRRYEAIQEARRFPWTRREPPVDPSIDRAWRLPAGIYTSFMRREGWTNIGIDVPASAFLVLEPIRALTFPARVMFDAPGTTWLGLLLLVWTMAVWSLFGAAICRVTAVQVARNGHVGLVESLKFSLQRYLSFFSSPILPFLGIALIVLICFLGSLFLWIPAVDILVGVVWFLVLVAGFVMMAALLGLILGWPLMYAAIAAEATESFDALSRSFSYVLGRPWRYLFYGALAIAYGALCMIFVTAFAAGFIHLSKYAVSWGYQLAGDPSALYAMAPAASHWGPDHVDPLLVQGTKRIVVSLIGFWTHVIFLAIVGFAYSYFWSQVTTIYFLLRRDVDETEVEEVYLEEEEEEPFPTATPTVPGPKAPPTSPTPAPMAPPGAGLSLPIVEPPQ